jgi:acetylornithine deacetylase
MGSGAPEAGSISQAHKPDEYIEQSQLDACDAFLVHLADWAM